MGRKGEEEEEEEEKMMMISYSFFTVFMTFNEHADLVYEVHLSKTWE